MKKIRMGLMALAAIVGAGSAFAVNHPKLEIMMNETTLFRRKLTHCFGAN